MIRAIPAQHQTDPAKAPGQVVLYRPGDVPNDIVDKFNHDMMDAMALHSFMHPAPKPGTIGEYARRKMDAEDIEFKPCRDMLQGWDHV